MISTAVSLRLPLLVALWAVAVPVGAMAQSDPVESLEIAGLPAVNFDSDEGFGYGALAEIYRYRSGDYAPYVWTLQPKVFLTTRGRREVTLFFDAPHVLPGGWRMDVDLGLERRTATPYYGVGNSSPYDSLLEDPDGPDPHYYDFGRERRSLLFNLQRPIAELPLRMLFGGGLVRTRITPVPDMVGSTLYASDVGATEETYWTNYIRGGVVWDTRDRESAPTRGSWTEILIQRADRSLGADGGFTRVSFADRRYYSLTDRIVFAHRYIVQGTSASAPLHELQRVETSFKPAEGLGGSRTVRGLPKNRYVGRGLLVWNSELRWRATDFQAAGRSFHIGLSAFLDQGRVWGGGVRVDELLTDLHRGYGAGLHVGMGENFVASFDAARSSESDLSVYIGLGYLY
jgi:outer membrane protein assembly factor BamA